MPTCCVPGCRSGYKSVVEANKKNNVMRPKTFRVPGKNQQLFEKWKRAIPRGDREITEKDYVCSLHFEESQINKYYTTLLRNGTIHKIERGTWTLQPDAVPVNFPNQPNSLSKTVTKRKLPTIRQSSKPPKVKRLRSAPTKVVQEELQFENVIAVSMQEQIQLNQLDDVLLHSLKLPPTWSYTTVDKKLVFLCWDIGNEMFNVTKKLVLNENMQTQVFVSSSRVAINEKYDTIRTLDELYELLDFIHSM